ncbi:hypothetical protein [Novosphingobium sp. B-7]|uniref:hypothetical protein n=1 Tax=Novosphingobium sp. B-7 TaxID=1298855 RepID=UPI0011D19C92|nr:hypothetical protein [Novosphingobium sp. B-7]
MPNTVIVPPVISQTNNTTATAAHMERPTAPQTASNSDVSAAVTAWATVALVGATIALAWLTWILARATSRASVVVTIEPNPAAINFVDMHIINEGNASAFDVQIKFEPPLPESGGQFDRIRFPSRISAFSAGQRLVTSLCEAFVILDERYVVTVSWLASPRAWRRQSRRYPFDLTHLASFGRLGNDPAIQAADELKKIRENLDKVVSGRRLRIDYYSHSDRMRERREADKQRVAIRRRPASLDTQEEQTLHPLRTATESILHWFKGR